MKSSQAFQPLKVLLYLLCCALVLTSFVAIPMTARADGNPDAVVKQDRVSFRTGPSRKYDVIRELATGTTLTLIGRNREVTWVQGSLEDGTQGWVALQFLNIRRNLSLRGLPIVDAGAPSGSAPAATQSSGDASSTGDTTNNPPPAAVSGSVSGSFELGGQVQFLSGSTVGVMNRAGMKWVKQQAFAGDGNAVGAINAAHGNGLKILLSVIGEKGLVTNENYQDTYASYVASLAASGADAIEVWNEQNIDREWPAGQINPAIYVNLLAKSFNAIKDANRNTIVITGAPAPTGAEGAFGLERVWNDDRYYSGLGAAGAGKYADCIGIHYNEGIVSPNQSSGDPRGDYPTRYFTTMLNRALKPFPGKKGCFTELGFLTPEGYGPLPGSFGWAANTSANEQATWLAQAALKASNSGRVRLMIIFNVDFTYYGEDPQAGYAIVRPGGVCVACDTLGSVMR